jgi:hypothetical protein
MAVYGSRNLMVIPDNAGQAFFFSVLSVICLCLCTPNPWFLCFARRLILLLSVSYGGTMVARIRRPQWFTGFRIDPDGIHKPDMTPAFGRKATGL